MVLEKDKVGFISHDIYQAKLQVDQGFKFKKK